MAASHPELEGHVIHGWLAPTSCGKSVALARTWA